MIIGFTGKAHSGKDTAAEILIESGWVRKSFADKLRDMALVINPIVGCSDLLGECKEYRLQQIVEAVGWEQAKNGHSEIRRFLQVLGTDAVRNMVDENVWVDLASKDIKPKTVFTDVRFSNEADVIWGNGGHVIEIVRPDNPYSTNHQSEDLAFTPDFTIFNDGTVQDLWDAVTHYVSSASQRNVTF